MIPISLKLSGFLSYREPVELDFSSFNLACISGHNGAGKSSLLDAITWALFGRARKRDDESLINLQSDAAEVALTFRYEGNVYRIQRTKQSGKSAMLEFQIQDKEQWRTLSERSTRETQARIEQTLRLDYDTFTNASFFLQGQADQFTQQNATKRKEVLSNILGLEIWEEYKTRTAERRKSIERDVDGLDGRITEIDNELAEEEERKKKLADLQSKLALLSASRKDKENALASMKSAMSIIAEQQRFVNSLTSALEVSRKNLSELENRYEARKAEQTTYAGLKERASEIRSAHQAWQKIKSELEQWDTLAAQFHEQDKARQPLINAISVAKTRLEQEMVNLNARRAEIDLQQTKLATLQEQIARENQTLTALEKELQERENLESNLQQMREAKAQLQAENTSLHARMTEIKTRMDKLADAEGADCPLCGQALSQEHRQNTLTQLEKEGKAFGDQHRANVASVSEYQQQISAHEAQLAALLGREKERITSSNKIAQWTAQKDATLETLTNWEATGAIRLQEINQALAENQFAQDEQQKLSQLDEELKQLGYDSTAHELVRISESGQRRADEQFRKLESANAALTPLEREITDLSSQIKSIKTQIEQQQSDLDTAAASLAAAKASSPDAEQTERELLILQEEENKTRHEVGAAQQKVVVLKDMRARKKDYLADKETFTRQITRYKALERAFGKDGVPAMLIEQALPDIQDTANKLLDRLSNGSMSIRFNTLVEYKDKKREDKKETLDIMISDSIGVRDYEMYSGGEAFRVNFAIRLALSEVLAKRKGARLQTLVIDEGFGSQDEIGRQRLVEAINMVKDDFAKILVITHLDELKDAFPTRIEIEKTTRGSSIHVI